MTTEQEPEHRELSVQLAQIVARRAQLPRDDGLGWTERQQMLDAARLFGVLNAASSVLQAEAVASARQEGASWSEVGSILGISRQAAQQRFSADRAPTEYTETRIIGVVSYAEELDALRAAGLEGWRPIESRHGEHLLARTERAWDVTRASILAFRRLPSAVDGWEEATSRFPDLFYIRPMS